MKLREEEKSQINRRVEQLEAGTGVQVLAAVSAKSDTYPEIPWKAFSLGTALAALAATMIAPLGRAVTSLPLVLWAIAVLSTGLGLAVISILMRPAARLFLGGERAEAETRQFALSFFLDKGLDRTRSRTAVLLLVSQFERRAAVVADTGISERIPAADLKAISTSMNAILVHGGAAPALIRGLTALEELLRRHGFNAPPASGDEVTEEFLETEGPSS